MYETQSTRMRLYNDQSERLYINADERERFLKGLEGEEVHIHDGDKAEVLLFDMASWTPIK